MPKPLPIEYARMQEKVEETARSYGLDMFRTVYEMLDYDEINMVASYTGFPVRYPHWKWGMEYERLSKSYEYGMNKIYEMVINNDPCYAYLLESNSDTDQKLVMCHVAGHNDFFKSNFAFSPTNRRMIDEMANHASRIRRYMDWYGVEKVETFIDCVLSIENLIDPHGPFIVRERVEKQDDDDLIGRQTEGVRRIPSDKEYMERYFNPDAYIEEQKKRIEERSKKAKRFPLKPERDILRFLMHHAPLTRWQRDILDMLREEAYYFVPQAMTKIMNEGWASYWHAKLMTEKMAHSCEIIDFADRHAGVMATSRQQLNPYKLGLELYRDIEERWNKGQFGPDWDNCNNMADRRNFDKKLGLGREKIFQVRKIYTDLTFLDEFFTMDFCKRQGFFSYGYDRKRQEYLIESREFETVKKKLLSQLTNLGQPSIQVIDANFENRSELLLDHLHEGVDLDVEYARETLKSMQRLWTRPVNLLTTSEERQVMYSYDGENWREKLIAKQV